MCYNEYTIANHTCVYKYTWFVFISYEGSNGSCFNDVIMSENESGHIWLLKEILQTLYLN